MDVSPRRSWLYRNRVFAVTLTALALLVGPAVQGQDLVTQFGHKPQPDKGPRALGLVQLSSKGKARLIPVAIMVDGKFFDASAYKASPVPMALEFGIVYEGFHSGVSQGTFTITQPGQLNHTWIAEGKWLPVGQKAPETSKKYSKPVIEDKDAPPVLHRHSEADGDSKDDKDQSKDQKPATTPTSPTPTTPAPAGPAGTATDGQAKPAADVPKTTASGDAGNDPNRPVLRRGKPDTRTQQEPYTTFAPIPGAAPGKAPVATTTTSKQASAVKESVPAVPETTFIPAISDAGGPEARPYIYDLKPAEEINYQNKMLDLAATLMKGGSGEAKSKIVPAHTKAPVGKSPVKTPKAAFDNVKLRIFDLSNSNEPILVLSATTLPEPATGGTAQPQEITLIARTNLEGEPKKLFFSQTDSLHLDVTPRMEVIDAIDADGDGRGELLFRRTFDGGSAFAVYRVTADQLWPLFEGTP